MWDVLKVKNQNGIEYKTKWPFVRLIQSFNVYATISQLFSLQQFVKYAVQIYTFDQHVIFKKMHKR